MSNAAPWATGAGNNFREVVRTTEDPTTKLLAEAIREFDAKLERLEKSEQQLRPTATP